MPILNAIALLDPRDTGRKVPVLASGNAAHEPVHKGSEEVDSDADKDHREDGGQRVGDDPADDQDSRESDRGDGKRAASRGNSDSVCSHKNHHPLF